MGFSKYRVPSWGFLFSRNPAIWRRLVGVTYFGKRPDSVQLVMQETEELGTPSGWSQTLNPKP